MLGIDRYESLYPPGYSVVVVIFTMNWFTRLTGLKMIEFKYVYYDRKDKG